jgi:hypothetical protein
MQTSRKDFAEATVRKFMTVLFIQRAKRHLAVLAAQYKWTAAELEENERRFIQDHKFVPVFLSDESKPLYFMSSSP